MSPSTSDNNNNNQEQNNQEDYPLELNQHNNKKQPSTEQVQAESAITNAGLDPFAGVVSNTTSEAGFPSGLPDAASRLSKSERLDRRDFD